MSEQSSVLSPSNEQAAMFPEKRWALVVGVDNAPFSNKNTLDYAVSDARTIAEVLQKDCGFQLVCDPLLDEAARSADVLQAITRKLIADRKDDDFLLFYFAGHGIPYRRGDSLEETDIYLGTADFSPQDVVVHDAHLTLKLLRKLLFEQPQLAGKVLIILDCCFAGNMSGYGPDVTFDDIRIMLSRYFDTPNVMPATTMRGLRLALAATTYNRTATEADGHGALTRWLLPALSGEANDAIDHLGRVTFNSLRDYLQDQMKDAPPCASGTDAGRNCILAYHSKHPVPYFPYGPDPLFRPREGELESLKQALLSPNGSPVRLGLVGMGGVGKSQLARELVCCQKEYFTDGIFWVAGGDEQTGETENETGSNKGNSLIHPLAMLASKTRYLPPGDDSTRPNEELRARHLCRFLAKCSRALLILDNLEAPEQALADLSDLAGADLQCTILYTSRKRDRPRNASVHSVEPLKKEQDWLSLLVEGVQPVVFERGDTAQRAGALEAARAICSRVGGLPLALTLLRSQLEQNEWLTLADLDSQLRMDGVLAVAYDESSIHRSLAATLRLSWRRVESQDAQVMFLLAAYFPAATLIPLWLLALACGMDEDYRLHSPFMQARSQLRGLSLVEDVSKEEIQMHPLLCEFGQMLVQDAADGAALRQEAAERVIAAFEDVQRLEQWVKAKSYWDCLAQIRVARAYVATLQPDAEKRLLSIERHLDQETYFLATSGLWPEKIPGLFYQQMYNRMLEEEQPLPPLPSAGTQWLRQLERVGIRDTGLIRVFSGHTRGVNSVAFSPDGSKVLTGSEDGTARIFETASGKTLHVLRGHTDVVECVAYSPDGAVVLTGSRDYTARLWDAESGECLRVLEGHTDWITGVAFSPLDACILTGSMDGSACLWENTTGKLRTTLRLSTPPSDSSDGIITTLWEEANEHYGTPSPKQEPYAVSCTAFAANGSRVLLGHLNGLVSIWDTKTGILLSTFTAHERSIMSIASSPDGSHFLTGSSDWKARLWKSSDCSRKKTISAHTGPVASVAFSSDGSSFLTGSWDRTVCLWSTRTGAFLQEIKAQTSMVESVVFAPQDRMILTGHSDGIVRLWECNPAPQFLENLDDEEEESDEEAIPFYVREIMRHRLAHLTSAAFSRGGSSLLVGYCDSTATLWKIASEGRAESFNNWGEVTSVDCSRDGKKVVVATHEHIAYIWNRDDDNDFTILRGHVGSIHAVVFSLDGRRVLTGSADTTARIWDTASGRTLKVLPGHVKDILCVAFSPDGKHLLTGSQDGTARLWKQRGRDYLPTVLPGHEGWVENVAFSPDGTKAFTGSQDALLRIWDVASGKLLIALDSQAGAICRIACSPDNTHVVTGNIFNQVRLWDISAGGSFHLSGAYATNTKLLAIYWQDNQHILLADDIGPMACPRIYTLRLES